MTFYADTADLPPFDDYGMAGRTYRFFEGKPLFPFGFGLGYSEFAYSAMNADVEVSRVRVSLSVENSGAMAGEEVVQLYVVKPARHQRNPIKSLCAVRRVFLRPGERKTIELTVDCEDLAAWDVERDRFELTPGPYIFRAGPDSSRLTVSATVTMK